MISALLFYGIESAYIFHDSRSRVLYRTGQLDPNFIRKDYCTYVFCDIPENHLINNSKNINFNRVKCEIKKEATDCIHVYENILDSLDLEAIGNQTDEFLKETIKKEHEQPLKTTVSSELKRKENVPTLDKLLNDPEILTYADLDILEEDIELIQLREKVDKQELNEVKNNRRRKSSLGSIEEELTNPLKEQIVEDFIVPEVYQGNCGSASSLPMCFRNVSISSSCESEIDRRVGAIKKKSRIGHFMDKIKKECSDPNININERRSKSLCDVRKNDHYQLVSSASNIIKGKTLKERYEKSHLGSLEKFLRVRYYDKRKIDEFIKSIMCHAVECFEGDVVMEEVGELVLRD